RAWLVGGTGGSGRDRGAAHMRRTASLDAIFNKGSKDTEPRFSLLLLNKATQTPEEWVPCCLAEVTPGCGGCSVENSNGSVANSGSSGSSSGNSSRRASGSVPSSPWPTGGAPPPSSGENFEKFIRQRLQRANKEGSGAAGSRHSPIHGDHSVLAKPYACVQTHTCTASNEGSIRSASVLQLPRPLLPRFRSSVEELNQEIERLVLRPQSHHGSEEEDEWSCIQQDGRRAPIPDYFRFRRSVNTQTPARYSSEASGNGSNQSTPPSMSPTFSPPPVQVATPPDSPPGSLRLSTITSPHINKFLAREPPDGCEKVSLKHSEDK
ncbi:Glucocorticoid-induced transcript 1 protein, partial [Armadillidium nasatum]